MRKLYASLALIAFCSFAAAEIETPRIFSDKMVLQQGQPVAVWGKANPSSTVEVLFAGQKVSAKADKNGDWKLFLKPLKASKTGADMTILENGKESKKISDAIVGEVWVAGGQSNMEFSIGNILDSKKIVDENALDHLRFFYIWPSNTTSKTPAFDSPKNSRWISAAEKNTGVSAMAFLFGAKLANALDMPVGMVQTSMSGTPMRSWVSPETFATDPLLENERAAFEKRKQNYDFDKALEKWTNDKNKYEKAAKAAKAEGKPAPRAPYTFAVHYPNPDTPDGFKTPTWLYNGKVAPVAKYAARGFLWYQGENDAQKKRSDFADVFKSLIGSWRKAWGNENMPFIFVQLPSFQAANWAETRLAQDAVCREMKNVYMAVAFDTGMEKDVHPKDKFAIGQRLGNIALNKVYLKTDASGVSPTFKSADLGRQSAKVVFETNGAKLVSKDASINGFEVSPNGVLWTKADAKITSSNTVTVSAGGIRTINAVRYGYKSWFKPEVNLYDSNGLPAAPFETIKK